MKAVVDYGFDGVKVDACGQYLDMALYAQLLNASGRQVLLENCHWGMCSDVNDDGISGDGVDMHDWTEGNSGCPERQEDGSISCPFHFFRTSGDIDSSMFSWLRNLESAVRFLDRQAPLAGRGCWAYPDMIEVGNMPGEATFEWQQAHFGAWCIMSAPLVLGFDLRNEDIISDVWAFVANEEAIEVSQSWSGHPGWRVKAWTPKGSRPVGYQPRDLDSENVFTSKEPINVMQAWAKPMPGKRIAILIINADADAEHSYSLALADLGAQGAYAVRDVWDREHRGIVHATLDGTVTRLASEFIMLTPVDDPPPAPSPSPAPPLDLPPDSPPKSLPVPPSVSPPSPRHRHRFHRRRQRRRHQYFHLSHLHYQHHCRLSHLPSNHQVQSMRFWSRHQAPL